VLGLNKPSGLMVHSDGRREELTLVDWINQNYPDLSEVGEQQILQNGEKIKRPGIVHRLDRETSGVILVAKTKEAHAFLKKQFQQRKIEKIYNAVVWGGFAEDKLSGVIDKPIGRSASDFRKWSAEYGAKGELREAVTEYKVLVQRKFKNLAYTKIQRSSENSVEGEFAYLELRPKTGRTHQIRVHLKAISHPVVCDKLYSNNMCGAQSCLGFDRLALHALSIKIELPNSTFVLIESPLPPEFENVKQILTKT
jgi:23S rRNA pseudouridine1911/1915/1917 synthase